MIITITLTLLFAALRGYTLRPLVKEKSLYPFFALELALIVIQVVTHFGIYLFVPFAAVIKTVFLMTLLVPFFQYKLYRAGSVGAAFIFAGTLLNKIAIHLNGGKMPVFPSLSYRTGFTRDEMFTSAGDTLHVLGNELTKCKILTDIFDVGYSVLSIGDLLIRVFVVIILYSTIAVSCAKRKAV